LLSIEQRILESDRSELRYGLNEGQIVYEIGIAAAPLSKQNGPKCVVPTAECDHNLYSARAERLVRTLSQARFPYGIDHQDKWRGLIYEKSCHRDKVRIDRSVIEKHLKWTAGQRTGS